MATKTINVDGVEITATTRASRQFEGTVVITDPCYFIEDKHWQAICDQIWFDGKNSTEFADRGVLEIKGAKILYSSTAYGDGGFLVAGTGGILQSDFGVDAGMMAVISKSDYDKLCSDELTSGLYAVVEEFDGEITADGKGNFIGDLEVYTDDSQSDVDENDNEDLYDNNDDYESDGHNDNNW